MNKIVVMLILTLMSISQLQAQRANLWERISDDKFKVAFSLPNKPEKTNRFTGKIPSVVYQTKNLVAVMGVVCSDFGQGGLPVTSETVNRLYQEMKVGSLEMPTAVLKNEGTVPFNDLLVKEIEYTVISGKQEMTYFKRFIFRDGIVYQMTIGGRSRHRSQLEELKGLFFGSIKFS